MPDHTPMDGLSTRLLAVQAAVEALRRGMPAIIGTAHPMALLAVETADEAGRAAFQRLSPAGATLLLSASRATAILPIPAQARIAAYDAADLDLAALHSLADPTYPATQQRPPAVHLPAGAEAALALAVLARLLPALLVSHALERVSQAAIPLEDAAEARLVAFRSPSSGAEQYAVLVGHPEDVAEPLVRVHSECFTGDLLGSLRCDCGSQLRGAIRRIAAEGAGAVLYLAQEGRGIGLPNKLRAYTLQDRGMDTLDANLALGFSADQRTYLTAAAMLRQLGLPRIRLLSNNPDKLAALAAHGIEVVGRESLLFAANGVNDRYLQTKANRFGHLPS